MDPTKDILSYVMAEKQKYEDASQEIRNNIKKARQNYMGQFLNRTDSQGKEKVFIPMTRWEVDILASKTQVNDKAITVLPMNEESVTAAYLADRTLKHQMAQTRFPTRFRNGIYDLEKDGTFVYAIYWDYKKGKKNTVGYKQIDVLDCYIDPRADSIQDAPSFAVKNTMTLDAVKSNPNYTNTEELQGETTTRTDEWDSTSTMDDMIGKSTVDSEVPLVTVYQRWGDTPKWWITGKRKDKKSGEMISGVVEIANIDDTPTVIRVEENPFDHELKPFEECWHQKVQGRWYGIGVGEKLISMQSYLNKTVNRAIKNEDTLHAGIFKKKRGSGLSTRSIVSSPGGVIEVDDMKDLEQLDVRDISQLSQPVVNRILAFVERINGASDIALGASADRSATTSLIKDRNADTRFAVVRGNINDFLIRFFKQWVALDRQFLDKKYVIRVTGEDMDLERIDSVAGLEGVKEQFRFIEVDPKDIRGELDLEVDIDQSQPQNKAENGQRILQAMQVFSQMGVNFPRKEWANAYAESVGLRGQKYKVKDDMQMMQAPGQAALPQGAMQQFQASNPAPMQEENIAEVNTQELPASVIGQF